VNGFLNMLLLFCGTSLTGCALFCRDMDPRPFCDVNGLALRFHGWKSSASSSTKLDGNRPTMRLSRFKRPIHHEPSPALRHSMRSPSMNPRSRLVYKKVRLGAHSKRGWVCLNLPLLPTSRQLCTSRGSAWAAAALRAPLQVM
jgi:hypothetical protein